MNEKSGKLKSKPLTLRARGLSPRPDYTIVPAAGSLIGDMPSLRDDPERANAIVERMLEVSGVRRRPDKNRCDCDSLCPAMRP